MEKRTELKGDNIEEFFLNKIEKTSGWSFRYGGYYIFLYVREFFFGKPNPKKGHDNFADAAETLVANIDERAENAKDILEASERLLSLQRAIDDTQARRRLERWATRIISWYLMIVLLLVLANAVVSSVWELKQGFISSAIIGAILTTTTINIIGLGLIVLKGHFTSKENKEAINKKLTNKQ